MAFTRTVRTRLFVAAILLAVCGGAFAYGVLVGKYKLFPYYTIRNVWNSAPTVKRVVAPAVQQSINKEAETYIDTNLLPLRLKKYNQLAEFDIEGSGGAIEPYGNGVIGVDGAGQFFLYEPGGVLSRLDIQLETGETEFLDYVMSVSDHAGHRKNAARYFRILDMVTTESPNGVMLVVSYHYWDKESNGKVTRVAHASIPATVGTDSEFSLQYDDWSVIYESTPPITVSDSTMKAITSNHTGGRMAIDSDGRIVIGFGEHRYDGVTYPRMFSQDSSSSYGKLIRIDPEAMSSEVIATGVRNPQGMMIDADGRLWETEHGPRGGDELNLIRPGSNYGWPIVTLGTNNGGYEWPLNIRQGRHDDFVRPVYAWVPSIGISNVIQLQNGPGVWQDDLLVSSLSGLTLFRIRLREERVVLAEPIEIGERTRDLVQLDDGTLIVFADNARFLELQPVDPETDESLVLPDFTETDIDLGIPQVVEECQVCHSLDRAMGASTAPPLWGVFDRPIASSNYSAYSTSLSSKTGNWSEELMRSFLLSPSSFAPGSTMPDPGLQDDSTLTATIKYLQRLK